jgi:PST family polysaccharide transporter
MSNHSSFFKNALWQYGLQALKYLLPFVTLPYLTRVLEPEGYAVYAYVVAFMGFVQTFLDFGFNLSGTKGVARAGGAEAEGRAVGAVTEARLLLGALAAGPVLLVALALPITRENVAYTALAYAAALGRALLPDFVFQGHERMGPLTARYLATKGLSTALTFVLVRSSDDLLWVPALDVLSGAVGLAWSFAAARRLFGTVPTRVPLREALAALRESALYAFSNLAASAFSSLATVVVGVAVEDRAEVSYWSLGVTALSAVQSLWAPVTNSLYPHVLRGGGLGFARRVALAALPAVLAAAAALWLLADPVVLLVGGEAYLGGSWVLRALSPVVPLSFYAMLLGWPVLGASGRVAAVTRSTVASGAFCTAALLALALAGAADLRSVCAVRCAAEALLLAGRAWGCRGLSAGKAAGGRSTVLALGTGKEQ